MGFRTGAFAKVWESTPQGDTSTKLRLSVSRKSKKTGEYEQEFSGFVTAFGTATAGKAAKLKEGDRIKLGDVDVTTRYDKERKTTYVNYKLFSFDNANDASDGPAGQSNDPQPDPSEGYGDDKQLPF